ncbi:DUF4192 domain-containing protein [Kitasatospora sp. NPDC096147]|uniref:DUF4192 domain-containing protein n=1 Tax=Kitasatospora sp. NPDC096147 TaxID=3364093 RepID=UPI003804C52E
MLKINGSAALVEAVPYLLGHIPEASIVLMGLGPHSHGILRIDLAADPFDWADLATGIVHGLIELSESRGHRPERVGILIYLDPADPDYGHNGARELQGLFEILANASRSHGMTVTEAVAVTHTHWWSYLCSDPDCCPLEGKPVQGPANPGHITEQALAAGMVRPRSRAEMLAELAPFDGETGDLMLKELTAAEWRLPSETRAEVVDRVASRITTYLEAARSGEGPADLGAPGVLDHESAAELLFALRDLSARDTAIGFCRAEELEDAAHLWRVLARSAVGRFAHLAIAPLTLFGFNASLRGDNTLARIVLHQANNLAGEGESQLAGLLIDNLNLGGEGVRGIAARALELRAERE